MIGVVRLFDGGVSEIRRSTESTKINASEFDDIASSL